MKRLREIIRDLLGSDPAYHRQASEVTAIKLQTELRRKRADKLQRDALALRLDVRTRGYE